MNDDTHESSSSGCDHHIELIVSHNFPLNRKQQTTVHNIGYDPFSYCGRRIHVLLLTKIISILTVPLYISIIGFVLFFGNATSVMFAVIILGSVMISTIYGAFHGAKMCLIPFVALQLIFVAYNLVLIAFVIMAMILPNLFISNLIREPFENSIFTVDHLLLISCSLLACLLAPLLWTTHVVYITFLFISQIDETLHMLKEANQKISQDEVSPNRMMF